MTLKILNKVVPVTDADSAEQQGTPLAKYLAHAGLCSRRAAERLVREGVVTVNGVVECQPHRRVTPRDRVMSEGVGIKSKQERIPFYYFLLNKPEGFLCTASDPEGRKTVFELVPQRAKIRLHTVGRLDCNSTGLILITNDGELTQRLTHPKYEVEKTYRAQLHRPLSETDMVLIKKGLRLDDGICSVKSIELYQQEDARHVEIVLSSGKNRIIRRLFEALGYIVKRLDRIKLGPFSKKGIELGCWRRLTASEVARFKKR